MKKWRRETITEETTEEDNNWAYWSWKHTCLSCRAVDLMIDDLRRRFEGATPEYEIVQMYQDDSSIKNLRYSIRVIWWYDFFKGYKNGRLRSIYKALLAVYGFRRLTTGKR